MSERANFTSSLEKSLPDRLVLFSRIHRILYLTKAIHDLGICALIRRQSDTSRLPYVYRVLINVVRAGDQDQAER